MEELLNLFSEHPIVSAFAVLGALVLILALGTWAVCTINSDDDGEHVTTRDLKNLINRKPKN